MIYNLSNSNAEEDFEKWLNKKENRRLRLEKLISPKQVYQIKKYKVGFNNWLREIGEPPSLYDSKKVKLTNQLFKQYYDNLGYFNSKSAATVTEIKNKKVSIPNLKWYHTVEIKEGMQTQTNYSNERVGP